MCWNDSKIFENILEAGKYWGAAFCDCSTGGVPPCPKSDGMGASASASPITMLDPRPCERLCLWKIMRPLARVQMDQECKDTYNSDALPCYIVLHCATCLKCYTLYHVLFIFLILFIYVILFCL